jgi:ATP-dependent DNA ligase
LDSGKLVYVGMVGSGFSDKELQEVIKSFKPASATPFSNPPGTPGIKWLKPDIVVEVAAMEYDLKSGVKLFNYNYQECFLLQEI